MHVCVCVCVHVCVHACRRKAREAKQYSKQVQAEKQKERNAQKKKQIADVSKLRKQREKSVSCVQPNSTPSFCAVTTQLRARAHTHTHADTHTHTQHSYEGVHSLKSHGVHTLKRVCSLRVRLIMQRRGPRAFLCVYMSVCLSVCVCVCVCVSQGFAGDMDYDAALDAIDKGQSPARPQQYRDRNSFGKNGAPSKKRQARDAKYGG